MKRIALTVFAIVVAVCIAAYFFVTKKPDIDEGTRIFIPRNATSEALRDTLCARLGESFGGNVFTIWKQVSGDIDKAKGSYVINPGEKAYSVANRLAKGRQTPIKLTINVARTLDDLTNAIASRVEATPSEISAAMDSVLLPEYASRAKFTAAILPDTYDIYWNDTPSHIIKTLATWRDKFWNDERLGKASAIGLNPVEVTTLASIVEEESNKKDEQPTIARLYLNRLAKGMKLQADPTVKFALGDFALRRITGKHLEVNSPYNTYKVNGLPPGPIRVPQKSTIDAVLNSPMNDYLYMCAKEDFSGYHNFAQDYDTHLRNAKRYATALDKRGIH